MRARHARRSLLGNGLPSLRHGGPRKSVFQESSFDAGDLSQFEDLNICDKVTPVDVEDGAETTLMEVLEESEVAPAGHPHLGAVEKNGENYHSVDKDLGFVLPVLVMPHPFVQSTEGTVCFSKPVVHFFVYSGI